MTDLQIIRTPSGDELVVMPKAAYDALVAAANAFAEGQDAFAVDDAHEAEERHRMTLEAMADVDAGCVVDHAAVQAWADSLDTNETLPVPQPR